MSTKHCTVEGCPNVHYGQGLCAKHHRHALASGTIRPAKDERTPEWRFMQKVEKTVSCWNWTGADNGRGYGRFYVNGRLQYAHRWSYVHFVGEIADGLTVDHICRNTRCVNPEHLDAVPQGENNRRRWQEGVERGVLTTACAHGHPLTPENIYVDPRGHSGCRRCKADYARRNYLLENTECPICDKSVRVSWIKKHMSKMHPERSETNA